ncbi:MAG: cytochrome c5 family protein [Pseudomonadales bacterium]
MKLSLVRLAYSVTLTAVIFGLSACGDGDTTSTAGQTTAAPVVETASEVAEQGASIEASMQGETKTQGEANAQGETKAGAVDKDILAIYQRSCISCHLSGAVGAPRTHDESAWMPKLAKGMPALIASINNGLNGMPPKGMCYDCTDAQYEALIDFMAGPKPK